MTMRPSFPDDEIPTRRAPAGDAGDPPSDPVDAATGGLGLPAAAQLRTDTGMARPPASRRRRMGWLALLLLGAAGAGAIWPPGGAAASAVASAGVAASRMDAPVASAARAAGAALAAAPATPAVGAVTAIGETMPAGFPADGAPAAGAAPAPSSAADATAAVGTASSLGAAAAAGDAAAAAGEAPPEAAQASADGIAPEAVVDGEVAHWQEVARCDFLSPQDLGRFVHSGSGFAVADGRLGVDLPEGHETISMREQMSGDVRISFDFTPQSADPGDVTVVFGAAEVGADVSQGWAGYEAKFGGPGLGESRIKGNGGSSNLARAETPAFAPGRTYRLAVEHVGDRIRMLVDGKTVLETRDAGGDQGGTVGLMLWRVQAGISNWSVARPAAPGGRS